jgi:hypothetical protein
MSRIRLSDLLLTLGFVVLLAVVSQWREFNRALHQWQTE